MSHLVIDIGNTRAKWAVFNQHQIVDSGLISEKNTIVYLESLCHQHQIKKGIYANVRAEIPSWLSYLAQQLPLQVFSTKMNNGVESIYETPHTLGLDRWASVLAASVKYPQQNCLVVDAGTCITYDLLTQNVMYLGGAISPGIQMRLKAMHHFTGKLPLIELDFPTEMPSIGTNTNASLKTGALKGTVTEIEGMYQSYLNTYIDLKMILTGGDASFLFHMLKNSIFAHRISYEPNFVLEGIHSVLH